MSLARTNLAAKIAALRSCMAEQVVIEGPPAAHQQNQVASMFRNGLAVLEFATIEDFIRQRTAEVLDTFSNTLSFDDLSEKLQTAVTTGALKAILFRQNYEPDPIKWTFNQLKPVARAETNITSLSPLSFGQSSSNIGPDDVSNILSAFGIEGGWTSISTISRRVGIGGAVDYCQSFKNMATRRHKAAHNININIPLSDLVNTLTEIIGICCGFDLLLSHAHSLHNIRQVPKKSTGLVRQDNIKLRFISAHPTKLNAFREQIETVNSTNQTIAHTVKIHNSIAAAKTAAVNNCALNRQQLVILDARSIPEMWFTWQ